MEEQYRDDSNLQTRIDLHARFSTNPEGWQHWLFDRIAPPPGATILEVGCGSAAVWRANLARIDPTWTITLTDLTPGMIDAARGVLGDRVQYAVADVGELPFPDASFDVVVANHMLYHVADRPRALAEIARVLVPGGTVHASTNGEAHFRELHELVGPEWSYSAHIEDFGLVTGRAQLEAVFDDVTCELYEDSLAVTEAEPLVAYVHSSSVFMGNLESVREVVEARLERDGVFHITKSAGLLSGRRP